MSSEDPSPARSPDKAGSSSTAGLPEPRKLTDTWTMRALAHPVRVALIEELTFQTIHSGRGMTATELGEAIGETATTCSFHLRQLAKYGFVEEAGGGRGRARPWRMKSVSMFFAPSDDPGAQIASDAALRLFRERQFARYQAWRSTKATYPEEWRNASSDSEYTFYATPEELDQLNKDLHAQLMRFWERNADPSKRPAGALPVETLLLNYPIAVPRPADDGQSPDDEDGGDEDRDDEDRDEDG